MKSIEDAKQLKVFQEPLSLRQGRVFHLRFGPLDLFLEKTDIELILRFTSSHDWLDTSFHYEHPFSGVLPEKLLKTQRVAFSRQIEQLKVIPCLGERSFVARPLTRLSILPGESAKMFLTTPMSVQVLDWESSEVLSEVPVMKRTKTWFGADTTRGEVCFFTNINAALKEENLSFCPHRAMTHVHIVNRSKRPIPLDRLKIPVPYLRLFQKEDGRFITSSMDIECDTKGEIRNLKIRPPRAQDSTLTMISKPRLKEVPSFFSRPISELLR